LNTFALLSLLEPECEDHQTELLEPECEDHQTELLESECEEHHTELLELEREKHHSEHSRSHPIHERFVEEHHTQLLEAIWAICSEVTWCLPAHVSPERPLAETIHLFAAETGFALAELRLLLGSRLPE